MRRESTLQQQQEEHQRRRTETVIEFTLADQLITTAFLRMLVLFVITLCIVKWRQLKNKILNYVKKISQIELDIGPDDYGKWRNFSLKIVLNFFNFGLETIRSSDQTT